LTLSYKILSLSEKDFYSLRVPPAGETFAEPHGHQLLLALGLLKTLVKLREIPELFGLRRVNRFERLEIKLFTFAVFNSGSSIILSIIAALRALAFISSTWRSCRAFSSSGMAELLVRFPYFFK
jgi:hypothetical protein